MQTFPVKLPLGSQPQDTSRKLVRPDFVIAIELERQPGFIKGCFQDSELLWIKRSVAQSRTESGAKSRAKSGTKCAAKGSKSGA